MRTPGFWRNKGVVSTLLLPVSAIYGAIAARRRDAHPYACPVPVICIGNVTAGGSGKTPVAQALMTTALGMGIEAHFLTRGYGGGLAGPVQVESTHCARDVGDEPLLLARLAPTWVSRDRAAGAEAAAEAGAQLIIMDDGLQNPHIVKDVSVLVVDGGFGFGNGRLLPAGPLREKVDAALAKVDAVITIKNTMSSRDLIAGPRIQPQGWIPWSSHGMTGNKMVSATTIIPAPHQLTGQSVIAFAGLGRPDKFRETLEAEGVRIVEWFPFPDHHPYSRIDLDQLLAASRKHNGPLVTTEKDHVRLPEDFRAHVLTLPITLKFDDAHILQTLIRKAMAR